VGPQVFHPQGLPEPRDGSRPPGGHGPWGGGEGGPYPDAKRPICRCSMPRNDRMEFCIFRQRRKGKRGVRGMQRGGDINS